jgi:hypothetical protein
VIYSCREALVWRAFKSIICTPASRSPARLVKCFLSKLENPRTFSSLRAVPASKGSFCGARVRADLSWWLALELVADSGEAALKLGARLQPTSHMGLESPWGRGETLCRTVEGRSPRNNTVLRRRSTGLSAAEEARYGGFSNKYPRTQHLLRSGDSIPVFDQPLPHSIPNY